MLASQIQVHQSFVFFSEESGSAVVNKPVAQIETSKVNSSGGGNISKLSISAHLKSSLTKNGDKPSHYSVVNQR